MLKQEIVIPYNEKNILVISDHITNILKRLELDIVVKNLSLYQEAFTHKSYIKKEYFNINLDLLLKEKEYFLRNKLNFIDLLENSNERLEFLGDTIIKCVIAEYLFKRYYNEDEGFMTRLKTKLEDTKSLAKYAKRLGLHSN